MQMNRRDFVKQAAVASAVAPGLVREQAAKPASAPLPLKIGMTDWNLGQRGDITKISLAREIGLDGIQVSLQFPVDGSPSLRDPENAGGIQESGARKRRSDLFTGDWQPGKIAAPAAYEPGGGDLLVEAVEVAPTSGRTTSCCRSSATATSTWRTRRR